MTQLTGDELTGDDGLLIGFKAHLHTTVVPGEGAFLVSERGITALRGTHAEVLAPLLDGTRSIPEVLREAAPLLSEEQAVDSLRRLAAAGLLRARSADGRSADGPTAADPASRAYWDLSGLDCESATERLTRSSVRIVNLSGQDPQPLAAACAASGLTVGTGEADLSLVICDDYLSPLLREVDAAHRESGRSWLLCRPFAAEPWVGPLFRPGDDSPCWSCLAVRLGQHRGSESTVQERLGLDRPLRGPEASLPASRAMALNTMVMEAAKWLAGIRYPGQSAVHTLDTVTLRLTAHPVRRRPQCVDCGDPGLGTAMARAPFVPAQRTKAAEQGTGHRALTHDQMLDRYGHLISPVTGIVKEVRRDPRSPGFIQSYVSGSNIAMGAHTLAGLRTGLRTLSGGKGTTDAEAKTSALGEAVERYCGTRQGDEPVVLAPYSSLGPEAVHPNAVQLYDERQFAERERWNARHSAFQYVPPRFDEDRPVEWSPVWSLTEQRSRLLPTCLLYYPSHRGTGPAEALRADSNGNAAGASAEDAVLQGFLELVERDAVALWWYNRTRQPLVDLDAFAEPYLERLTDGCRRLAREVWALDLTSDLGIPVFAVLSRRTDKPAEDIVFGFGAHHDPRVALRRAATEMAQLLPAACDARADGTGYRSDDPEARAWWRSATVANQPYLTGDPLVPARRPADWNYRRSSDLGQDVTAAADLLRAHGLDLLVLNQSRPDVGLPVVRVVVPGLRHFWARFAPGRLFDVPVALGRLARATAYEDLNPVPLFV
ncbi:TOMM precursor leader peptide-binding protein [Streptomyces sp. FH025]|uniref:TOMM precursor leader peptide-binding protein n=1 Tax=Streptomyces sp. FH025 TaxID=2815937 RepID=UPI001A9E437A|nr:TOMM precursor leader peptide-binding protein [Streptomyces sp. FH025]MBO1413058.1 TOMM precursor leader peptide-binding protein [Streptomyces sp. FH025]